MNVSTYAMLAAIAAGLLAAAATVASVRVRSGCAAPRLGPLVTLTGAPRAVAAGGVHELDGRRQFVGRGVGVERAGPADPPVSCVRQVVVLTLADG